MVSTTAPILPSVPVPGSRRAAELPCRSFLDAVDSTFNLDRDGRQSFLDYLQLPPADQQKYLETVAALLRAGVVGKETVEIGERRESTFATTRIAGNARSARTSRSGERRRRMDVLV